jgi:hypothetical protein
LKPLEVRSIWHADGTAGETLLGTWRRWLPLLVLGESGPR